MPNNNPLGGSQWPQEHCEELKRMAEEGKSYRVIAYTLNEKFGTSYNRNAAIGKATRMGISKKPAASVPGNRRPRTRSSAEFGTERRIKRKYESVRIQSANGNSKAMRIIRTVTTDLSPLRCVEVNPLNLTLADLPANGCHYIAGDDLLYCGHPIREGSSYCPSHHFLCWMPARPNAPKYFSDRAAHGRRFSARTVSA